MPLRSSTSCMLSVNAAVSPSVVAPSVLSLCVCAHMCRHTAISMGHSWSPASPDFIMAQQDSCDRKSAPLLGRSWSPAITDPVAPPRHSLDRQPPVLLGQSGSLAIPHKLVPGQKPHDRKLSTVLVEPERLSRSCKLGALKQPHDRKHPTLFEQGLSSSGHPGPWAQSTERDPACRVGLLRKLSSP